jgi:hypothetical protein
MVTRRRFLSAAAAGAAMLSRMPHAVAATYDLIIKGGRVIDPSLGIVADSIERCMKQGFAPDTFSTDWNTMSCTTGGTSLT